MQRIWLDLVDYERTKWESMCKLRTR